MKVVLADLDAAALRAAEAELSERGVDVAAVVCDTASPADVSAVVAVALDRFGGVHLMCNNVGIVGWRRMAGPGRPLAPRPRRERARRGAPNPTRCST